METRCQVDASIANYQREFEAQKAEFDVEVNHARAEADLANELQVCTFLILIHIFSHLIRQPRPFTLLSRFIATYVV